MAGGERARAATSVHRGLRLTHREMRCTQRPVELTQRPVELTQRPVELTHLQVQRTHPPVHRARLLLQREAVQLARVQAGAQGASRAQIEVALGATLGNITDAALRLGLKNRYALYR